jgi:hypothetical protein
MGKNSENRGVTGKVNIVFAIPTDDPRIWRMKNGILTYGNGATVGIDVEGGYIPHFKGNYGLSVTYCVFKDLKQEGNRIIGDVAMSICVNGRMMETNDIAFGIEVTPPSEWAAALAGNAQLSSEQS